VGSCLLCSSLHDLARRAAGCDWLTHLAAASSSDEPRAVASCSRHLDLWVTARADKAYGWPLPLRRRQDALILTDVASEHVVGDESDHDGSYSRVYCLSSQSGIDR
jgi:hypothetical protein